MRKIIPSRSATWPKASGWNGHWKRTQSVRGGLPVRNQSNRRPTVGFWIPREHQASSRFFPVTCRPQQQAQCQCQSSSPHRSAPRAAGRELDQSAPFKHLINVPAPVSECRACYRPEVEPKGRRMSHSVTDTPCLFPRGDLDGKRRTFCCGKWNNGNTRGREEATGDRAEVPIHPTHAHTQAN